MEQNILISPEAVAPILRFVKSKLDYNETNLVFSQDVSPALRKATAMREVETAVWSVCILPETAALLAECPRVRDEFLKLLDYEQNGLDTPIDFDCTAEEHIEFASDIRDSALFYNAIAACDPLVAQRIDCLARQLH